MARAPAEQTTGRELAALTDGPWAPCWYWRDDLEAQQAAARDLHRRDGTAQLGDKACYRPTDRWIDHPSEPDVRGRVWTYQPHDPEGSTR